MSTLIPILLFLSFAFTPKAWESTIDPSDGMSYFNAAEDLLIDGIQTSEQRLIVEQLFVLSAVVDPLLRDSAILGLISIEHEEEFVQKLLAMRTREDQLLVPSVILASEVSTDLQPESYEKLYKSLSNIRIGRGLTKQEADTLRPWRYMFPQGIDKYVQRTHLKRAITPEEVETTLRIELAILGGATVWSADYAFTGGRPVALSANDDLAALMHVDPTLRVRRDGTWVVK